MQDPKLLRTLLIVWNHFEALLTDGVVILRRNIF